jgi:hypothetical protein
VRFFPAFLVLVAALAACTGGASTQCVAIVDDAVDVFQDLISTVDDLDLSEAASDSGFTIPGIDQIDRRADILQADAIAARCDDAELRDLLTERIVRLEARTVFGQAVIEGIRQEGLFSQDE